MAVEIQDVEQVAQDLQQKFNDFKAKLKKASWPEKLKHLTAS